MAKNATAPEQQGTGVVVAGPGAPPAELLERMRGSTGRGVSTAQEDNQTPLVRVLQAQSPQVLRRNPEYVEGAEAGAIFLKNAPQQLIDGEVGFDFQPCHFSKDVIEWKPRDEGGGFVARHQYRPGETFEDVAKRVGGRKVNDPENPNAQTWLTEAGNELVETRNHAGFILVDGDAWPFVITYSKSGLTVSREWMGMMNRARVPGVKTAADSWLRKYRMRTKLRTNAQGEWFQLVPTQGDWVQTMDDIDRGQALFEAFESGARRVADEDAGGEPASGAHTDADAAGI